MSSSYSSLDWVLSHWAHFTVRRFVFVCICVFFVSYCILHSCIIVSTVGWTRWDWSLILLTYLPSVLWHCWLGHLTRKNPVTDMTYNVFGGTLNLTQSITSAQARTDTRHIFSGINFLIQRCQPLELRSLSLLPLMTHKISSSSSSPLSSSLTRSHG